MKKQILMAGFLWVTLMEVAAWACTTMIVTPGATESGAIF